METEGLCTYDHPSDRCFLMLLLQVIAARFMINAR
jgi:hypothetical protein